MVSNRAFIFYIYNPWGRTFLYYQSQGHLSRSNIKVTVSKKWPLQGHSCFTHTSCFFFFFCFIRNVFKSFLNFRIHKTQDSVENMINPFPDTPILGSSNSMANKDMMSKIWTNGNTNI